MSYITEALEKLKSINEEIMSEQLLVERQLIERTLKRRIVEDLLTEADGPTTEKFVKRLTDTFNKMGLTFMSNLFDPKKGLVKFEIKSSNKEELEADWDTQDEFISVEVFYQQDEEAAKWTYRDVILEICKSLLTYLMSGKPESVVENRTYGNLVNFKADDYGPKHTITDRFAGKYEIFEEALYKSLAQAKLRLLARCFDEYGYPKFEVDEDRQDTAVDVISSMKYEVSPNSTMKEIVAAIKDGYVNYIKGTNAPNVEDEKPVGYTLYELGKEWESDQLGKRIAGNRW